MSQLQNRRSRSQAAGSDGELSRISVGTKILVYWPDDDEYYPGVVASHHPTRVKPHLYKINYDDGDVEKIDLAKELFRIVGGEVGATTPDRTARLASRNTTKPVKKNMPTSSRKKAASNTPVKNRINGQLKPSFEVGDLVYAAWWPEQKSRRDNVNSSWFPGIVKNYKQINFDSPYGTTRTYHIRYDDGDELHDVEEQFIFAKEDYELFMTNEGESKSSWMKGVKNVVDKESIDDWARIVGWYVAIIDGEEVPFARLSDAMNAYDDHIVQKKGKRTKTAELNRPERFSSLFNADSSLHSITPLLLYGSLFGESVMVTLHLWIILGFLPGPTLDAVQNQPDALRYFYLLCDATLPIIAVAMWWHFHMSTSFLGNWSSISQWMLLSPLEMMAGFLVAAHTLLYTAFAWDETNMDGVLIWAYSPWRDRWRHRATIVPILPGLAVCLDLFCHLLGLAMLLKQTKLQQIETRFAWTTCAVGGAVGACTMAYLQDSP